MNMNVKEEGINNFVVEDKLKYEYYKNAWFNVTYIIYEP